MDKIDIILWVLSGGFGLMLVMWHFINNNFEKIDKKLEKIDERFSPLETRIAVIESKLSDISTNVSHLMWHQSIPQKEADEQ